MELAAQLSQDKEVLERSDEAKASGAMYELEGRAGLLGPGGFANGSEKVDFNQQVALLMSLFRADGTGRILRIEEWEIEDVFYGNQVRARTARLVSMLPATAGDAKTIQHEVVEKRRVGWIDYRVPQRKYDMRLGLKSETPLPAFDPSKPHSHGPERARRKQLRRSFWTRDNCRIDTSIVQPSTSGGAIQYEIEAEHVPNKTQDTKDAKEAANSGAPAHVGIVSWLIELNTAVSADVPKPTLFLRVTPTQLGPAKVATNQTGQAADTFLVATSRQISRPPS
jgi:hypothetical protein